MPLIGRQLNYGSNFKLDDISSQFNGTIATFNLTVAGRPFNPGSSYGLLVSLSGVIQEPNISYTVTDNQITFTAAPISTDTFFGYILGSEVSLGVPADRTITGEKLSDPFNYESGLLYLDSVNRRVGIDTTSPSAKLHVVGNTIIQGSLTASQYNITTYVPIQDVGHTTTSVSGTFTLSVKCNCMISFNGSGYRTTTVGLITLTLSITGIGNLGSTSWFTNELSSHKTSGTGYVNVTLNAGTYTVVITRDANSVSDGNDRTNCSVIAIPTL